MLVSLLLAYSHINDAPPFELLHEQVLRVDDSLAVVAGRIAHLLEEAFGFGGYGDDVAACSADAGGEGLELFEVGLAEGTPVAAVDWRKGQLGR